jgi:Glycosyltransferase family 87
MTVIRNSAAAPQRTLELPTPATRIPAWAAGLPRISAACLGYLSLAAIVATSLVVVMAAAERHSFLSPPSRAGFPGWMSGPLAGLLPGLTHHGHALEVEWTIAVAGTYALYVLVLASLRFLRTWPVLAAIGAVHLIFFLSPPLLLTDVFNYLNYARMGAVHGLNPYVHLPVLVKHDPAYRFTTWHHLRSPYGPLFTLGTYALTPFSLPVGYWVFKFSVMSASLGCLALVWKCAKQLGRRPLGAVTFVGLNPLFLVYGLGGQHNDVFMMLLVLAGVYLMLTMREHLGGAAFVAAVAVKASAGVLLPVVLLGARRSLRAVAGAAAAVVVLAAVSVAVFGPHLPNDAAQSKLVVPFGLANELGLVLGLGGVTATLRRVLQLVLVAGIAGAAFYAWRGRGGWPGASGGPAWLPAAAAVSLLLVLTLTWVMPWYVFWVLPLAALVRGRALRLATVALGIALLWVWLPLGQDFNHNVLHQHPTRTAVGKENKAYLHKLLR